MSGPGDELVLHPVTLAFAHNSGFFTRHLHCSRRHERTDGTAWCCVRHGESLERAAPPPKLANQLGVCVMLIVMYTPPQVLPKF